MKNNQYTVKKSKMAKMALALSDIAMKYQMLFKIAGEKAYLMVSNMMDEKNLGFEPAVDAVLASY
ncbi:MAG: hypothetical protein HQK96_08025 [Nitrospirae bacterium]|nr:hypothetical protein [Nitrospirota bacterium]